jgi:biopolymer transport protein ExbB
MKNLHPYLFLTMLSSTLSAEEEAVAAATKSATLDLVKVFQGSPSIYTILMLMSVFSIVLWIYSLITLRISDMMPKEFMAKVRLQLAEQCFDAALQTCKEEGNFSAEIIACGIHARKHGSQVVIDSMHAEGRRAGLNLWQRISLLNDIAVIAPMLGLLGTVLGMFYAFYDTSQNIEDLTSIFDGLGIAIGTTVAGLIVAIMAMIFQSTLRFRVTLLVSGIENELLGLVNLISPDQATIAKKRIAL